MSSSWPPRPRLQWRRPHLPEAAGSRRPPRSRPTPTGSATSTTSSSPSPRSRSCSSWARSASSSPATARGQRPRTEEGPQVESGGHTQLVWTLVPTVVLVALAAFVFALLPSITDAPAASGSETRITVEAHQFYWLFRYPNRAVDRERDGRARRHRRAPRRDRAGERREPQLVGAAARRQDRRDPGPRQRDLVQDVAGHVHRALRRALRDPARRDDRHRPRRAARRSTSPSSSAAPSRPRSAPRSSPASASPATGSTSR